jgi:hypothetical protein
MKPFALVVLLTLKVTLSSGATSETLQARLSARQEELQKALKTLQDTSSYVEQLRGSCIELQLLLQDEDKPTTASKKTGRK